MLHHHHGSDLFSIVEGKVIGKGFQANGFGNYIIIKDEATKQAFLYGHMREQSQLNVDDLIHYGDYVGHEGTTGNSTGIHLHLESQMLPNSDNWIFGLPISSLENPATYLGIPNVAGISAYYEGTPHFPTQNKNSKKWLFTKSKKFNIMY